MPLRGGTEEGVWQIFVSLQEPDECTRWAVQRARVRRIRPCHGIEFYDPIDNRGAPHGFCLANNVHSREGFSDSLEGFFDNAKVKLQLRVLPLVAP